MQPLKSFDELYNEKVEKSTWTLSEIIRKIKELKLNPEIRIISISLNKDIVYIIFHRIGYNNGSQMKSLSLEQVKGILIDGELTSEDISDFYKYVL